MALSRGNIASWADIQSLYTALNTARKQFDFTTVTVPSNPGLVKTQDITNLNSLVNAMSSNRYLTGVAVTGVSIPNKGTPISATPFTRISSTIRSIQDTCNHCDHCSFGFDSFGFDSHCDNRSFGFRSGDGGCTGFTYGGHSGF